MLPLQGDPAQHAKGFLNPKQVMITKEGSDDLQERGDFALNTMLVDVSFGGKDVDLTNIMTAPGKGSRNDPIQLSDKGYKFSFSKVRLSHHRDFCLVSMDSAS
jgi:hypothetical protein